VELWVGVGFWLVYRSNFKAGTRHDDRWSESTTGPFLTIDTVAQCCCYGFTWLKRILSVHICRDGLEMSQTTFKLIVNFAAEATPFRHRDMSVLVFLGVVCFLFQNRIAHRCASDERFIRVFLLSPRPWFRPMSIRWKLREAAPCTPGFRRLTVCGSRSAHERAKIHNGTPRKSIAGKLAIRWVSWTLMSHDPTLTCGKDISLLTNVNTVEFSIYSGMRHG
jgi:hypothetical protein